MNLFWQNTNNVTYNTSFGDHHLTATAVFEASGAEGRNLKLTGSDLANEFVGYWNAKKCKDTRWREWLFRRSYCVRAWSNYVQLQRKVYADRYFPCRWFI